jgi:hypothetical protein
MTGTHVVIAAAMAMALVAGCNSETGGGDSEGGGSAEQSQSSAASGGGSDSSSATSGSTGAGDPGPCDGTGNCTTCQLDCALVEGGPCAGQLKSCLDNQDCVKINNCNGACLEEGKEQSECFEECSGEHPQGADKYDALVTCIDDVACVVDCEY